MILDILFAVTLLLAIFKGWSKGLIAGVFSLAALVLGAAAALKLSTELALYFQKESGQPSPFWPIVSFAIIFLVVALLVRLIASLLEKAFRTIMLGWLNRLAGIFFYALSYAIIFSICLWLVNQLNLLPEDLKKASKTYTWVAPIGPKVITYISDWIPWFKDMFQQLEGFFQKMTPLLPS